MKPKPDLDPEFPSRPTAKPWLGKMRSLGHLMLLVAFSGLVLAAYTKQKQPTLLKAGPRVLVPRPTAPGLLQRMPVPSRVDRPVIVAPSGIDEAMIVTAREGIDESMIVNPSQLRSIPLSTPPLLPPTVPGQWPPGYRPLTPQIPPP